MKNSKSCPPIISAILIAAFLSFSITLVGQTKENPNFLIIMTDQQAWDAVGYSGNKNIITPNMDRLASEGVNFSQAVTPCPVCVPARTSILTGRLAETTTIRQHDVFLALLGSVSKRPSQRSLVILRLFNVSLLTFRPSSSRSSARRP